MIVIGVGLAGWPGADGLALATMVSISPVSSDWAW